jgi:hypothetical protein
MTSEPGFAVGCAWGDVDNDGDLDLLIARDGQSELLYLNDGPPSYDFTKVTTGPLVTTVGNSFGCALVDVDGDGQLDAFVANRLNQTDFLFRNQGTANSWLTFHCVGTTSSRSAVGARVRVYAVIGGVGRWVTQEVPAQTGYNSQVLDLHFGLGDATVADSLVVRWPSGQVETAIGVTGGRRLDLIEGQGVVGVPPSSRRSAGLELELLSTGPQVEVRFVLPVAAPVSLRWFDARGRLVRGGDAGWMEAGSHSLLVPATDLGARGVYFCVLRAGTDRASQKLVRR